MPDQPSVSTQKWSTQISTKKQPRPRVSLHCGAAVQFFSHASYELYDVPPCEDHVFAYRLSGLAMTERKLAGRWETASSRCAGVTIIPAQEATSWRVDGIGEMMHLYIPPALLQRVCGESLPPQDEYKIAQRLAVFDDRLKHLSETLVQELANEELAFTLYAETLVAQIAISILRDHSCARLKTSDGRRFGKQIERRIIEYIEENHVNRITLGDLANIAGLGLSQFNVNFRATFGLPAHEYVVRSRVDYAKRLLAKSELPLTEIALEAGFAHQSHMTRTFKRVCRVTPSAYRSQVIG